MSPSLGVYMSRVFLALIDLIGFMTGLVSVWCFAISVVLILGTFFSGHFLLQLSCAHNHSVAVSLPFLFGLDPSVFDYLTISRLHKITSYVLTLYHGIVPYATNL